MKKNLWVRMLSLALALVCVLSLAACANGGQTSGPVGTYKLQSMDMGGMSMDLDALASMAGAENAEAFEVKLEIKEDGTFTLDMSAMGEDETEEGTWEAKDGKLTMTVDDESVSATLTNDELVMEQDGVSMTFKKA